MSLQNLRPMLWTEDLAGSVEFYTEVLGFDAVDVRDDWGWASLHKDNVWLMLAGPNEHTTYDNIGFTGSFYFTTDDVDALWSDLKDKVRVCYGIENFEWGMREFAVYDNTGYLL